jgi:hypothetical protein
MFCNEVKLQTRVCFFNRMQDAGYYFEDPGLYRRIRLNCILLKYDGRVWNEFIWLRIGICYVLC